MIIGGGHLRLIIWKIVIYVRIYKYFTGNSGSYLESVCFAKHLIKCFENVFKCIVC